MTHDDSGRRSQILQAASRLLCHYGFGKTTVADIAREAGIGVGTVYLEFSSKDAIVEALSTQHHAEVLAAMRAAAAAESAYAHRLCAVLDARVQGFLRMKDAGQHGAELVHCVSPGVRDARQRFAAQEEALFAELLAAADAAGEFRVEDAPATAAILVQAYLAFTPPAIYGMPRDAITRSLPRLHALLLRGLLRR